MTKDEIIKALRDMAKYPTVTLPRDCEALRMAADLLAQPEQEPVAWRAWVSKFPQGTGSDWVYVTKPIMKDKIHNQPLYTTPPQRTWVGLTDEEIKKIVGSDRYTDLLLEVVNFVEAKLKEKNCG